MKQIIFIVLATCLLFTGMTDDAYAFRCGNELVTTGDSSAILYERCGRPGSKDYAVVKFRNRWESVEKWYYNCGDNDFIYMLTILHDKVVSEDSLGRGSGRSQCRGR